MSPHAWWWSEAAHALTFSTARVVAIVLVALLVRGVLSRGVMALRERVAARMDEPGRARAATLGRVLKHAVSVVVGTIATLLVLDELGVSVAPLLATAGVAGVAVGFGAQAIVRDYLTGFLLLAEDQLRQGDVVRLGEHDGVVEEVTLRYVRLRNVEGKVAFVPNGEIKVVENLTRDYAQPLVEIGVAYREDVGRALETVRAELEAMRADGVVGKLIAADPEIMGVDRLAESAVILRARLRVVPPIEQWAVRREALRRLKAAFDARGIEIPLPQITVHDASAGAGGARATTGPAGPSRREP